MRRLAAALAPLFLCAVASAAPVASSPAPGRVVILGFDGVDASLVEKMMADGRLPNLSQLKSRGGYSPLTPTVPAQTPVSWATFSTGLDPGGTQIFDFLKRDPANRIPTFAVAEETTAPLLLGHGNAAAAGAAAAAILLIPALVLLLRRRRILALVLAVLAAAAGVAAFRAVRAWVPDTRPWVKNNRRGPVFWSEPGARPATVVRMPVTFPPEAFPDGRMLSGLGVPDLSGRIGRPSFYTSDPFFAVREGNDFSVEIVRLESNTGTQTARVAGPPGRAFGREGTIDLAMTLTVPPSRDRLAVEASGARAELKPGEWSDWLSLSFRVNPLVAVHGYARLRLASVQPEIALYMSPVQFDPDRLPPGFELSSPSGFARELVSRFGRFKTMGWAIDTWSIQSGTLPEDAFLEDVRLTEQKDRQILEGLLAGNGKLLFHYFEFPDRVAHVFWRFRDPQHPAYDAALAAKYGDAVEKSYAQMDEIVGATAKALKPEDVLVVLSDHGFATWRRSVNYNSWLVENGYLVLKGSAHRQNLEALFSRGQFWEAIDWTKSRAYAMGLGDIYVNLSGREAGGIVAPGAAYDALRAELSDRLVALTDPKNGEKAVSRVFRREQVYRRFDPRLIPDLIVANRPGYRVSWQSSLGVPTESVFEDNRDVWSGDHCSLDPDLVRGVLFASRPFHADPVPGIADATASIRALVGAPQPEDAAGKPLW
ncbi:MAG TPA: alkaline phosphatase family protein [Thermoanaerobaculia bacterium]|nr:alkaline phosphatase family protein [Thermoanaerobaculia bacterium]